MIYSVDQLAKLARVSIRTLHYYDEIGLLVPSFVRSNGYRIYEKKELLKLQQILFFRELEFTLEQIKDMMSAKGFDSQEALKDQQKLLNMKKNHIEMLLHTIDIRLKGGENMDDTQIFDSTSEKQMEKYKEEAKRKWGHTHAYKQSVERTRHWTKEDYKRIAEDGIRFTSDASKLMDRGVEDKEVQQMIEKHFAGVNTFYDCSYEMYRELGSMYVEDARFAAYYDKHRAGFAKFMRDAIYYYCDTHSK